MPPSVDHALPASDERDAATSTVRPREHVDGPSRIRAGGRATCWTVRCGPDTLFLPA
jgi:hypothetical protein